MKNSVKNKILQIVKDWSKELQNLEINKDIVAINFGAQKVTEGYELYLSGHTWFDGNDLWLMDIAWNPSKNYISLGVDSLNHDRLLIFDTLEKEIKKELIQSARLYDRLIVTVGLSDSDYIRLK
jgi:hypothetical protein